MSDHATTTPHTQITTTVPDWDLVRARADAPGWGRDTVHALTVDFEHWERHLHIPGPEDGLSAWTHHYFCDDDGEALRFDPDSPHEHHCQRCDRVYRGEPWDGAWRTRMHTTAAAQAQRAAVLARIGDADLSARAVAVLSDIVTRYAARYRDYEIHGVNVGKARVTSQNLDESIWTIVLLRSVRWAGPLLEDRVHAASRALAAEAAAVLEPQLGLIHNIHCWIVGALAECAVSTGDDALLATAIDGPFGARQQLLEGMHPEGLWFEVNPHYHFYTLNALLSFVEVVGAEALSGEPLSRLRRAVTAPAELAYSDGRIPAYGDGWPDSFLSTFAQTAEVASRLLPGTGPGVVADYLDERPTHVQSWAGSSQVGGPAPRHPGRYSVGALVFGADEIPDRGAAGPDSFVWSGPGIGVLRKDDLRLAMRFGPDAGWHDHHDKLAVDVELGGWRSLDLGTSGYGAEITDWMRSQVAHSLIIVGDAPQPRHAGELVHFDTESLVARSSWNGAAVTRTLRLDEHGWSDEIEVVCEPGTPLEWVFHGDGVVLAAADGEELSLPADELGHGWLREVHAVPDQDGTASVRWDHEDAPTLELTLPMGWTAHRGRADANPTGLPLGVIAARGASVGRTTLRATFSRADVAPPTGSMR